MSAPDGGAAAPVEVDSTEASTQRQSDGAAERPTERPKLTDAALKLAAEMGAVELGCLMQLG